MGISAREAIAFHSCSTINIGLFKICYKMMCIQMCLVDHLVLCDWNFSYCRNSNALNFPTKVLKAMSSLSRMENPQFLSFTVYVKKKEVETTFFHRHLIFMM
ncbi:hypothetical protein HZS_583 [Henneguya salminicola]|nr:hypothetical protein HZS_583 [Henneguya salminicola]